MSKKDIMQTTQDVVIQLMRESDCDESFSNIQNFVLTQRDVQHQMIPGLETQFHKWFCYMSGKYNTFSFWNRFLEEDMLYYIQLFIGIQSCCYQTLLKMKMPTHTQDVV